VLYWLSSYCIKTIIIIVYNGGIAHGLLQLHSVVFCLYFVYCIIVLFLDNLFFYLSGQSVSCEASLAALRLYGYFCDIVSCYYRRINTMMMMMHTSGISLPQ